MNAGPAPGTPLAPVDSVSDPRLPDPHLLARARPWFRRTVAPMYGFLLVILALLLAGGLPWPRAAAILAVYLGLTATQWTLVRKARTPADVQGHALWVVLASLGAQTTAQILTGGIASPLLPILALPIGAAALVLRRDRDRLVVWAAVPIAFLLLAVAPHAWTAVPAFPRPVSVAVALLALVWASQAIHQALSLYRQAQADIQCCLQQMQEEQVVAAKEQLRRLQSVGAKVAHELKNPLTAIKGLVQLVERSAEDPHAKERLAVVSGEIARMETILRDYLTYSRPLEDLHLEDVELTALVTDVRAVLSGRAEHAGVELSCKGDPVHVPADPRRLKEALINLVANAIEATPTGGLVEVAVDREPDHARITIHDTGAGMTTEHLTRVGTSFFTTRAGGTGLGVVLARNAIVQHGGGLRYASKPGAGTTVTVELPLRHAETKAAATPSAA